MTHGCHKRDYLLKSAKDRYRWLQWLREERKRYGLLILNHIAASNHIHLLVCDSAGKDVIPKSIQLVAGVLSFRTRIAALPLDNMPPMRR